MTAPPSPPCAETLQLTCRATAWVQHHDRCWTRDTTDARGGRWQVARVDWWPHLRDAPADRPYRLTLLHDVEPLGPSRDGRPQTFHASLTEAMAAADTTLAAEGWELLPYRW